jgi:hypothetical protein
MPRILKSMLALKKPAPAPSQPGLTPAPEDEQSGVRVVAQPPVSHKSPDPATCPHSWITFPLPAEGKGRVYQCPLCSTIGFRRQRFGGPGKIEPYTCSKPKCGAIAVRRMIGRGPRGAYIWSCFQHANPLIEVAKKG